MNRAYSLLTVKSIDESKRTITGVASTPTVDRVGDSVNPMGAQFKTPMPLLLYHQSDKPVGTVDFAKPTKNGIPFTASLPIVAESGALKDRVDEAWQSIKYKLIAAVSIGFRALKDGVELLKDGGLQFNSWEWLELSLVSVPANPDAVIQSFKSLDADQIRSALGFQADSDDADREALIKSISTKQRAASGISADRVVRLSPGVAGNTKAGVFRLPKTT